MRELIRSAAGNPQLRTFFVYALCGGMGVCTDMLLYTALVLGNVDYQIANAAGYASGTLVSFLLNRHFTFKVYDKVLRRLVLFFGTAAVGYALSAAMLWVFVERIGIHALPAKAATLVVVLVVQFSLNKAISFHA
jgi:putative flippase GtrA